MTAISVLGAGVVTAAGVGTGALASALADPDYTPRLGLARPDASPLPVACCASFEPRQHLNPLLARRLDRSARLLVVAAREALAGAGEPLPWPRHRIGVTAGTWSAGTTALVEVLRAVFLSSPADAPPMQFPSTVANAPASQLGILEHFGGPNLTFFEKQVGGLRAIGEGGRLLRGRRADAILAGGVDEAHWLNAEGYQRLRTLRRPHRAGMALGEGAAALLLAGHGAAPSLATLAGTGSWAVPAEPYSYPRSPAAVLNACRRALDDAGARPGDVELVVSMANGLPALDELEASAMAELFGRHRPAALPIAERLGEGAFAGALRVAVAALVVGGRLDPLWAPPRHLASVGFGPVRGRPATALVCGAAGGGGAVAIVVTAPVPADRDSSGSGPDTDEGQSGRRSPNRVSRRRAMRSAWVPGQ